MAQTRTAKGTVVISAAVNAGSFIVGDDYEIKTVGTTDFTAIGAASNTIGVVFTATGVGAGTGDAYQLTARIPNVSMVGGDMLIVGAGWDVDESGNPDMKLGGNLLDFAGGVTLSTTTQRVRVCAEIINNTRTADVTVTYPSSVSSASILAVSLHQAGTFNIQGETENLASTISTTGVKKAMDHIQTVHWAVHLTAGPSSDATGTSSTGHTLGQRVGTTSGTNDVTLQERYKIITATTVSAGSFVVDDTYQIKTVGTTDFTAIGAASNTVGVVFVATGVGSGTGDAYNLSDERSRLTGLATRDHAGIMFFFRPKQTFTIKEIVQHGRNMNHNPYWVEIKVEDESGRGFWINLDPDDYEAWSDAVIQDRVAKYCSTWVNNIIDSNLTYVEDTDLTDRFSDLIDTQVIL